MSKTVEQALKLAVAQLGQANSHQDTAKLDAEVLLAYVLDKSRTWLKTWPEKVLADDEFARYQRLIERRQAGEPVAYIVGRQDFWTLTLKVTPATLIPRPETEHLVELALDKIPLSQACRVADLGTGTGAIALAIASERPEAKVWAMDLSHQALQVAEQNRDKYRLDNVTCQQGHWLNDWQGEAFDLIVSNPPYIAPDDQHLDDLSFEPSSALVAEDQGLADIQTISKQAAMHLKAGGWLIFEHGFEQGAAVRQILQQHGFVQVGTEKDYAGLARISFGQRAEL